MSHILHIAEADADIREMLAIVLSFEGWTVHAFETAQQSRDCPEGQPLCTLIATNAISEGQDLKTSLISSAWPVIIAVELADVSGAINALKWGAADVVQKPYDIEQLVDQISKIASQQQPQTSIANEDSFEVSLQNAVALTGRERDVLNQITAGASNKEAGRALGISPRTVEVHRARVMEKLNAKNIADLVRIVLQANASMSVSKKAPPPRDTKTQTPYSAAF